MTFDTYIRTFARCGEVQDEYSILREKIKNGGSYPSAALHNNVTVARLKLLWALPRDRRALVCLTIEHRAKANRHMTGRCRAHFVNDVQAEFRLHRQRRPHFRVHAPDEFFSRQQSYCFSI